MDGGFHFRGNSGIGGWLLVAAVLDPEPFSKLAATIGAGAIFLSTGVFGNSDVDEH